MKRPTPLAIVTLVLGASVAFAQTETAPTAAPETAPGTSTSTTTTTTTTTTATQPAVPSGPQVQAEIVAVDAAGKTVTVRESTEGDATDAAGKTPAVATLPVEGNAVGRLGFVQAGSRVTLICAPPDASSAKTNASTTETSSSATSGTDAGATSSTSSSAAPATDTSASASSTAPSAATASSTTTTDTTASADTSAKSPLNATCGSVVEIAKARATTSSPQP